MRRKRIRGHTKEGPHLRITRKKRIRAHGGCLGIECRGRTWHTARSHGEACAAARVVNVRMGKPGRGYTLSSRKGREPGELKHLSTRRKREDSASSGERKRKSPNLPVYWWGL